MTLDERTCHASKASGVAGSAHRSRIDLTMPQSLQHPRHPAHVPTDSNPLHPRLPFTLNASPLLIELQLRYL